MMELSNWDFFIHIPAIFATIYMYYVAKKIHPQGRIEKLGPGRGGGGGGGS